MSIDLEEHFSIKSSKKIAKIVEPIVDMFGVKHFRYLKLYSNGERIVLSNNPDCIRFFYGEENYKSMWFDGEFPQYLKEGFYAWDLISKKKNRDDREKTTLEKEINQVLGLYHGLTIVKNRRNFWEIYTFDGESDNLYHHDRDLFIRACLYFKDQSKNIILAAENEKMIIPCNTRTLEQVAHLNQSKLESFINKTKIKRFYINDFDTYITLREAQCAYWLVLGKSAEEIACITKTGTRTVETHFENIKIKLNCQKQTDLVRIIINSGIFDVLSQNFGTLFKCEDS